MATIRALLEPSINLDIRFTTIEVDADTIASEAIARGANMIIVSGGDGTVSAAAVAVVGTNIPINGTRIPISARRATAQVYLVCQTNVRNQF